MLPQKILKSGGSEMPFPAFWAPNYHSSTSGNYSLCMAIRCEIKLKKTFSLLFLRTHSFWEKHTRIVCQPARQATETIIRSISCSLQLRLESNERKKFGDKMLKWTFGYYNFFSRERGFHSRKCSFQPSFDLPGLAQSTPQRD